MSSTFTVRLRGSPYANSDGIQRQDLVVKCRRGDRLSLVAEPDNPHDRHAVAVFNGTRQQLGYLPSDARDASSILRGEPIEAKVLKRIGGTKWWHRLLGQKRNYGLLITLIKSEIDWAAHSANRELAEKVDAKVKAALEKEKSNGQIESVVEAYREAMICVIDINKKNRTAAAHRYKHAPINRLTLLLVKLKRPAEAKEEYEAWKSVVDPIGLTKADNEALKRRIAKLG
ncbi:HIRAN domain-containing protein [Nitrosococcus watsonii]|uniref:HIRAN domain protein n=1 Tax=Nitrosococcus watsoni (strain C-113) TaxID=105559 RepID=D8K796_NITWC|nr:HIRAN domain-containing protein [Nitrosococcus watsonii]ADJ28773.1 HIRAN domain protein [Nitrosococcus watsonii C-113]